MISAYLADSGKRPEQLLMVHFSHFGWFDEQSKTNVQMQMLSVLVWMLRFSLLRVPIVLLVM